MKVNYVCEYCGKKFPTEEDAMKCEQKHIEEKEKQKRLQEEKETRQDEIRAAYKHYITLYEQFVRDYDDEPFDNAKYNTKALKVSINDPFCFFEF